MMYFAYGSDLDPSQMVERSPGHKTVGVARLMHYRLCFPRYSKRLRSASESIEPAPGEAVWGVLYDVPADDIPILHHLEGFEPDRRPEENSYLFQEITVHEIGGGLVGAMTYVAVPDDTKALPSADIMERIVTGARYHGLPKAYVAALLAVKTAPA